MAFFHFTIPDDAEPQRLDKYLVAQLPQYSRSFLGKCKLSVNGINARVSRKVGPGDKLEVAVPALKSLEIKAEKIPLEVIYEDAEILIINKPAGMVVHPTDHGGHVTGTLVNALLWHFKSPLAPLFQRGVGGDSGGFRPGLVHRLDKDTSGVMVVAKTPEAKEFMTKQFGERKVEKVYLALVAGRLNDDEGRIEAPIGRHPGDRTRRAVHAGADSREAITEFDVVQRFKDATLVKVRLLTGRTHQIRVHFQSIKHPVVGDSVYGYKEINRKIAPPRIFLHAQRIGFTHPKTKEKVVFEVPLPEELKSVLQKIKL